MTNAQQAFQRASIDLSAANDALNAAILRKTAADADAGKANDALSLAQQAFNDANNLLTQTALKLVQATNVRQTAIQALQTATTALQQANSDLSSAQWNL